MHGFQGRQLQQAHFLAGERAKGTVTDEETNDAGKLDQHAEAEARERRLALQREYTKP